ncbi:MAG: hypothetical protein KGI54_10535 [Pseudomonadota bacterium]|nr:hypothetical protein [Pseudomonadota bacterium]
MKDLIERLRNILGARSEHVDLAHEAADALERLTAGEVEMPEQVGVALVRNYEGAGEYRSLSFDFDEHSAKYSINQLKDYGDRRAAAAVLAEHDQIVGFINVMNARSAALLSSAKGTP